jgi:nicotinamidase-related amidase
MSESKARVGWVVEAQNDFLLPPQEGGRLYVHDLFDGGRDPGAVQVMPALVRAVRWMQQHCAVVVFTGDWHGWDDAEIDTVAPDARRGTYPPHCMGRSPDPAERAGAELHPALRPARVLVLERGADDTAARQLADRALDEGWSIFIHKDRFNVFDGNPAVDALLARLRERLGDGMELFVAGVARDVCVTQAVEGMLDASRGYHVAAIRDATWGLGLEPEEETLARWTRQGARLTTSRELPRGDRAVA